MKIIESIDDAELYVKEQRKLNKKICLIPTMGNLHNGHLELINKSPNDALRVVTIYVNHLQFDDENDYLNYPKNNAIDIKLCKKNSVDLVFMPNDNFLIELLDKTAIDLPKFTKYMCGVRRAGHFVGVYQVVKVLFSIFNPDYACFGKKDFQQLLLIKYITKTYFKNLKIIDVSTIRDVNNIALSSRLSRLSGSSLNKARLIYETLLEIKNNILKGIKFDDIKKESIKNLEDNEIQVEYIELRLLDTLEETKYKSNKSGIFIACLIGKVRLIDNIEI